MIRLLLFALLGIYGFALAGEPTVFEFLREGKMEQVRSAIDAGTDVNSRDERGNTLLMRAAAFGRLADLQYLVARGADVNARNRSGHTAVMTAIPDIAKIKLLVEHGADVNARTEDGATPLMIAARLVNANAVLRYLLSKGADVRPTDRAGLDALMNAAIRGAFENLKTLVDAGAKSTTAATGSAIKRPESPVFTKPVLDLVRRRAAGASALMNAAQANCEECARLLLDHGADPRARTEAGLTTLHAAAYQGNEEIVKLLLAADAPVNVSDDRGFTPLMMAANSKTKNTAVVRMLLDRGADPQAVDAEGRTAAEWAAIGRRQAIMTMLPRSSTAASPVKLTGTKEDTTVVAAVYKSLGQLRENGPKFFPKTGCISCHNVSIPMVALGEARRLGYDEHAALQQMAKQTVAMLAPVGDNLLAGYCTIPSFASSVSYDLISMHYAGIKPGLLTDSAVRCLLAEQLHDGGWTASISERPPLGPQTGIPGTALAARSLDLYAPPALSSEVKAAIANARTHLAHVRPSTGDDYAFRLLGLFWTHATRPEIEAAARDLLSRQRADGGWAQSPEMESDAYATGQALAAISMALPEFAGRDPYRRGVAFLMRTREEDGSWHVGTRAFAFQPYFESGFPHGHDQWISMAATAWATIALIPAAEPQWVAAR